MAYHKHTGAVGFNHRPNPHSAPFWDMNATPKSSPTKEETNVLNQWRLLHGDAGPSAEWLESESTIGKMSSSVGLAKHQSKFFEEQSMKPGVMARLQPRLNKTTISMLATNPQLAAKYYPGDFPQFAENVKPALGVLGPAEAREKNTYYPNQPGVIMIVSIWVFLAMWP